jgi:hypothetical protein
MLVRARTFWHDVFGLDPVDTDPGGDFYEVSGTRILVYETQYAGTAQNTAIGFRTDDLDRDMAELRSKGVEFNEYDIPGVKTADGIAEVDNLRGAWFNDSEGNIIGLTEGA